MYTALSVERREIRVLAILPTSDDSSIVQCTLSTVSFDDDPIYEALSYVWGDVTVTEAIAVDGNSFQATSNLVAALKQLRTMSRQCPIWVDAICIDQRSREEKNYQVRLMRDIYRGSQMTFAWLGQSNHESRLAFQLLQRWSMTNPESREASENRPVNLATTGMPEGLDASLILVATGMGTVDTNPGDPEVPAVVKVFEATSDTYVAEMLDASYDMSEYDALESMQGLPYWQRVWIIQEFALSQQVTLLWGSESLSYAIFTIATEAIDEHGASYLKMNLSDNHLIDIAGCAASAPSLLMGLRERYASKDEAGHATLWEPWIGSPSVGVNYLALVWKNPVGEKHESLPTWVLDFTNLGYIFDYKKHFYNWSDSSLTADPLVIDELLEMNVIIGPPVQAVEHWAAEHNGLGVFEAVETTFEAWSTLAFSHSTNHPSGFPILQVFYRTLMMDGLGFGLSDLGLSSSALNEDRFFSYAASFLEVMGLLGESILLKRYSTSREPGISLPRDLVGLSSLLGDEVLAAQYLAFRQLEVP